MIFQEEYWAHLKEIFSRYRNLLPSAHYSKWGRLRCSRNQKKRKLITKRNSWKTQSPLFVSARDKICRISSCTLFPNMIPINVFWWIPATIMALAATSWVKCNLHSYKLRSSSFQESNQKFSYMRSVSVQRQALLFVFEKSTVDRSLGNSGLWQQIRQIPCKAGFHNLISFFITQKLRLCILFVWWKVPKLVSLFEF